MATIIAIGGGETLEANKTIHKRIVELSKKKVIENLNDLISK
jgi:hypothetical protein